METIKETNSQEEKQHITAQNRVIGKPFPKGVSGNPKGRPKQTLEDKIIKKAVKQYLKEYEEGLAEALPEISPVLVNQAKSGNMQAVQEIHKVLGAHKKEVKDETNIQINVILAKINNILDEE